MYSAIDKGIDTMSAYETVKYPNIARKWMEIPQEETLAIGIALGFADNCKINSFISEREPVEDMLVIKN